MANAAAFRDLIVATRNDHPIRLGDVARVIDSVENTQQASWFDGQRSLVLAVQRQPDANTVGGGRQGQGHAAAVRRAAAAPRAASTCSTTARSRSALRFTTCR